MLQVQCNPKSMEKSQFISMLKATTTEQRQTLIKNQHLMSVCEEHNISIDKLLEGQMDARKQKILLLADRECRIKRRNMLEALEEFTLES